MRHEEDDYDFPPPLHPAREAATMGCAIVMAAALIVWLGMLAWRALSWL